MKKFILGLIVGAVLFTSVSVFANSEFFERVDGKDEISFWNMSSEKYAGGFYIDPNSGRIVIASAEQRDTELNSDGDIFLNAEGNIYSGYLKDNDSQLITMSMLKEEILKLQNEINELKK